VIRQYAHNYPQHDAEIVAVDGPLDMRAFAAPQAGQGGPPAMTGAEGLKAREGMSSRIPPAAIAAGCTATHVAIAVTQSAVSGSPWRPARGRRALTGGSDLGL